MATQRQVTSPLTIFGLKRIAKFPRMRALYWDEDVLYVSRGYELWRPKIEGEIVAWQTVGNYQPERWRRISSISRLGSRLFRDGFHALTRLSTGHFIAAVPKAIVTLEPGSDEFRLSHRVLRGTRPLHIASTP